MLFDIVSTFIAQSTFNCISYEMIKAHHDISVNSNGKPGISKSYFLMVNFFANKENHNRNLIDQSWDMESRQYELMK